MYLILLAVFYDKRCLELRFNWVEKDYKFFFDFAQKDIWVDCIRPWKFKKLIFDWIKKVNRILFGKKLIIEDLKSNVWFRIGEVKMFEISDEIIRS